MKINFIGSGNVATHLALALHNAGMNILAVYSQHMANAETLAARVNASAVTAIESLPSADLYIISVHDDAITPLAEKLQVKGALVVHTSGATSIDVLRKVSTNYGVFYPLQTFSKLRTIDFSEVPMCIEANSEANVQRLMRLAAKISQKALEINSLQRRELHLAAVFACNFTNHLFALSADLLQQKGLDFELLRPLISETCKKVMHAAPLEVQTGPALRGDKQTLTAHLKLLEKHPQLREIYQLLSESIKKTHS